MIIKKGTIEVLLRNEIDKSFYGLKNKKDASVLKMYEEIKKEPNLALLFHTCFKSILMDNSIQDAAEVSAYLKYFVYGFYYCFKAFFNQSEANEMEEIDLEAEITTLKNYIEFLEQENCELKNGNKG
jgi:cell division protein FtsB